jgi:putative membrane protein
VSGFYGRHPLAWVGFALAVLAVPLYGLVRESGLGFIDILPTVNATLNATSAVLLFVAWRAIKAKHIAVHRAFMLAAVATSALFLVCYLIRVAATGTHVYPRHDFTRPIYLAILGSHTVLAATVPFLVARALYLALRGRFDAHRRIARVTFPIWMYVSVTGVVVYVMLYHVARM